MSKPGATADPNGEVEKPLKRKHGQTVAGDAEQFSTSCSWPQPEAGKG